MTATTENTVLDAERTSLLRFLADQRDFLRFTLKGLDEEQAAQRTTVSELTLGGLVKHVTQVERNWIRFIREGATHDAEVDYEDPATFEEHTKSFRLLGDETLAGALEDYERAAGETERFVAQLPDLEVGRELPKAPWFPEGASWSARDVLLHLIRETAQHCGHADILREALDGQRTMG
ncbi:DinB family protein [Nocardiopsis quinghaiensis]|uniref:DinB family protein n=1 Tax=Nocardiopsis quinghaiensis TaxID=464995 RepID=UPI001680109E|nr:DinB family protein [Nocardiopsis quinghaiensis]